MVAKDQLHKASKQIQERTRLNKAECCEGPCQYEPLDYCCEVGEYGPFEGALIGVTGVRNYGFEALLNSFFGF